MHPHLKGFRTIFAQGPGPRLRSVNGRHFPAKWFSNCDKLGHLYSVLIGAYHRMDPLVRAAVIAQNLLTSGFITGLNTGLGVLLIFVQMGRAPTFLVGLVLATLGLELIWEVRRRRRVRTPATTRRDFEFFVAGMLFVKAALVAAGPALSESWSASIYVVFMLAAAFGQSAAAFGTLVFALAFEAARLGATKPGQWLELLWPQVLLGIAFTSLNFVVFRAEIARVRRLSRERLEAELQRTKEAARSYRLLTTPTSAVERTGPLQLRGSEERAQTAAVEEIHATAQFALDLLRRALGLQSAALLWLDASRQRLTIHELSSTVEGIKSGTLSARDGVIAACLAQQKPMAIKGPRAQRNVPIYSEKPAVGAVCAIPVLDHEHPRGVLLVDRVGDTDFSHSDMELLQAATRFLLRAIENERVFVQLEAAKNEQGKLYRAAGLLAAATTEVQVIEKIGRAHV